MITQEQKILVNIEDEMKNCFLDYAMSVIVGRALPDVRDGLKPVHRRVLFGMHEMGLGSGKAYRKSAKIVGEVMGSYHPHGDAAIYDTMVRMAQEFSMRYPLVDGQGNFGSVDGDPPAAMRYTEARLTKIAEEMLKDIDRDTVDFMPNYDESLLEPRVLPSAVPNLIINGSSGIAVGMATNIPPHNLSEIMNALIYMIDHPEYTIDDLIRIVSGPDFPTGAFIFGRQGIVNAYKTGRGRIVLRARVTIDVDPKSGKETLIVHELPYQVNKANLVEKIAELVKDKKLEGISDLRDESDRDGMRIVIEIKRGDMGKVVLNQLYAHTNMQTTFGVIMLALVNGRPYVLDLGKVLQYFLQHRRIVVIRRSKYDLKKAEERAHIIEGLRKAIDHIDAIIALIRASKSTDEAREGLINKFAFSERQAQAILEMRLARLTALERDKLRDEYMELLKEISKLKAILESEAMLMETIKQEFLDIKSKYADERRTEIIEDASDIDFEDLIAKEEVAVLLTHCNYIKRNRLNLYKAQKRSGQGQIAIKPKEGDFVEHLFVASTHHYLLVFTDKGKVYGIKIYQIPEAGKSARGTSISNLISLSEGERIATVLPVKQFDETTALIMATKDGYVKKTQLSEYTSCVRAAGLIALSIEENDELISVRQSQGDNEIFIATSHGMAIRFPESDIRSMGRSARGVHGIHLRRGDYVVGMETVRPGSAILSVTNEGYGKRTLLEEYRLQSRGGYGVINMRITGRNGHVIGIRQVYDDDEILLITDIGKVIRIKISETSLRTIGRSTQGVKLQNTGEDGEVVSMASFVEEEVSLGE